MKSIKWKILRRIGAFVLAAALVAGGQPFCSCADEAAAEEEIGPGIIPKVKPEDLTPLVVSYSTYQDSVGWSEVKADNDPLKVQTGSFASAIRMTVSGIFQLRACLTGERMMWRSERPRNSFQLRP